MKDKATIRRDAQTAIRILLRVQGHLRRNGAANDASRAIGLALVRVAVEARQEGAK